MSNDLASDSKDENQLNKDHSSLDNKHNDKKEQFRNAPFFRKYIETFTLVNQTKDKVPTKISSEHRESVTSVEGRDISSIASPLE